MHEKAPLLKAQTRERLGSRYAKRDRDAGRLPCVVYGHKVAPVAVTLDYKEANDQFEAGNKVFRMEMPGAAGAEQMVLLKDLQFDFMGSDVVHADFARVDLNEMVRTKVHVILTGEAKGLKLAGAILMHPTNELVIECRVKDIPESVMIDITDLDLDGVITADKVKLPSADMKLITDPHAVVAQIVEQKEIVVAEAAVVATEGGVEPEVIGEKERLEKAAAEGKPGAPAAKGAAPAAGAAKPAAGAAAKPAAGAAKPAAPKK